MFLVFFVDLEVFLQVARLAEPLAAGVADIRTLPCVNALMNNLLVTLGECLLTILARVRL